MQTKQFDWNDMNCFQLDVSMWSGRAKMSREDLKDPDAVPPDALASLGSLKLIDPDRLKIFNALKRRALRLLESHGVTFLSGYVVGEAMIGELDGDLRNIKAEYEDNVYKLVADYEDQCEEWLQANSQWAHIIRPRLPSAADIQRKFNFDWTLFKVQPAGSANHHGNNALDSAKDALGNTAVDEVSKMLGDCARNLLKTDRTQYSNNAFNAVDKAIGKCDELAFINPELGVLSSFLKEMKQSVLSGAVSADNFRVIFSAVASPASIRQVIELRKADLDIGSMAWALQPSTQPQVEHGQLHIEVEDVDLGDMTIETSTGEDGLDGEDSQDTPFDFEAFNEQLKELDAPEELQIVPKPVPSVNSLANVLRDMPMPQMPSIHVPSEPDVDVKSVTVAPAPEPVNVLEPAKTKYATDEECAAAIMEEFASRGAIMQIAKVMPKDTHLVVSYGDKRVYVEKDVLKYFPDHTIKNTVTMLMDMFEYKDNPAKEALKMFDAEPVETNGLMNLEGII